MDYLDLLKLKGHYKDVFNQLINLDNKTKKNIYLSECASNVSKMLATFYFNQTHQNIIYVTQSIYEASKAYEVLSDMAGSMNVSFFPVEEFISSEMVATTDAFRLARMLTIANITNDIPQIIVTNTEGITRQLMDKQNLNDAILNYQVNDVITRDHLVEELVIRGYKKVTITSVSGTFSVRGSLIDVFPINENTPIRINFFDNEIETIKKIDSETQMSIEKINSVKIFPVYEIFYPKEKINDIKQKILDHFPLNDKTNLALENLENYQNLEQLYIYLPLIVNHYQPFIELFNDPICIYEDYQSCLEHEKTTLIEISEYLTNVGYFFPKDYFISLNDCLTKNKINIFTNLFRQSLNDIYLDEHFSMQTTNCFEYNNNIKAMIEDLKANENKKYLITHLDLTKLNFLEETFKANNITYQVIDKITDFNHNGIYLAIIPNAYGFKDLSQNIEIITPNEFSPDKIVRSSKYQKFFKDSIKIYSKDEISPGDYVVHQDYGIGKYLGIKTRELRNTINDYLCVEYAEGSTLYIPVENIYVLEKYVGSKDKLPKLNNLNSKEWQKKKAKIKEKTKDVAKRLIKVQAERELKKGFVYKSDSIEQLEFENDFLYTETPDQKKAIEEVKKDMESPRPLDRLICGDVGFGKTEVAMRAAFKAVDNGKQVAYLAPTTVLTRQHFYTFKDRFEKFGVRVELLNRFVSPSMQTNIIKGLKNGYVDIVIGTHRILSDDIKFKDLGLLIIDEEQRFGVEHKEKIKLMKSMVDVLTLSATPIPRTLQMALSGLRDLSLIETPPTNRLPIQTYVLESNDSVIREAINREMGRHGQVFYLLNRISELDVIRRKINRLVPNAKIGIIHGKMDKDEIEDQLIKFLDKAFDILICTTIIETGIDIPNANTLIIERANILGLAQLYQIRGRVGRSDRISYAYLMYDKQSVLTDNATKRLEAIKEFTELGSGYKIAMRDLAIRGSGDILGSEQSGYIDAVGMDLYMKLLNEAINEEKGIVQEKENIRKYNVSISRHIEEDYAGADALRIDIHKSINKIKSRQEIDDLIKEYTDRYGTLSSDVRLYMEEKYLEYLLKQNGVESFKETEYEITFNFDEASSSHINLQKLFTLSLDLKLKYKFDYKSKRIIVKINPHASSNNYIYDLTKFLEKIKDIKV